MRRLPACLLAATLSAHAAWAAEACGAAASWSLRAARLAVRNTGAVPCTVPALPRLVFQDAEGNALPIARRAPPGMHPGPVMLPRTLPPGRGAAARLGWAASGSACLAPVALRVGAAALPFGQPVCGRAGQPLPVTQPPLSPVP